MNRPQLRRGYLTDAVEEDGPFVSFTDLFIGILFLFLILVAALILMHQEAVGQIKHEVDQRNGSLQEAEALRNQYLDMKSELEAIHAKDADYPPFRLAIAYNRYEYFEPNDSLAMQTQEALGGNTYPAGWVLVDTTQIFRSPNGQCIENVVYINPQFHKISTVRSETVGKEEDIGSVETCALTSDGFHFKNASGEVVLKRMSEDLYEGLWTFHTEKGDQSRKMQLRTLGIYDAYYRYNELR